MSNDADSGKMPEPAPENPPVSSTANSPEGAVGNAPPNREAAGFGESSAPAGFPQTPPNRDYLGGFLFDAPPGSKAPGTATDARTDGGKDSEGSLEERVVEALRGIYDPEIPVNIYDLGLIYGVEVDDKAHVVVTMTLTTPHCPVAEIMPGEVERRAGEVEGASGATVNLVWDPPWDPSKMTEEAQLELGFI